MSISDVNIPLLRVGDKLYRIESRPLGNTKIRQKSVITRTIKSIEGDTVRWHETNSPSSIWRVKREYTLFHPAPPRRHYSISADRHEEEVKHAAALAARQRADFSARRKAAKAAS